MKLDHLTIDILLATYNGDKYIEQQIDSIINQTYTHWNLLFRDDGSTDDTVNIIQKYIAKYPDKMYLMKDSDKSLGPSGNFSRLLEVSEANYTMFCDQDDVWKQDKIEKTLQKMKKNEEQNLPVLVHTDLEVVDTNLNTIAESMFDFQKLKKEYTSINYLLVQNNITGCTMMINKRLREMSKPIPKDVIMHDWWLALVAGTFGKIAFLDEATIKYRQHGANDTGAKKYSADIIKRFKSINKMYKVVNKNFVQANSFYERYKDSFDQSNREIIGQYASLLDNGIFGRLRILKKQSFHKQGTIRDLGFKFILATLKNN